jgi:hypothetical protein
MPRPLWAAEPHVGTCSEIVVAVRLSSFGSPNIAMGKSPYLREPHSPETHITK